MPILQPKIHTRVTVDFASGKHTEFVFPLEASLFPASGFIIDENGVMHHLNPDRIEHLTLSQFQVEEKK